MSNKLTEWKNLPLNKVFDIARGGSPRPIKNYITEDEDGINWIKIGDTKNSSKYIYNTKQKIKSEGVKKSQLVKEDDFILSNSMSFGKPYIMKTRGCIHDGWLVLRKVSKETSIDYMYYLLSSSVIKNQFENKAAGSTVRNLNIKLVSSVKVSIPPYQEQQKIADILSTVDEKIGVIEQQITATEEFKKGLMQRLLTKGIGHTEFKDSPLGKIPKSWDVKKLSKIAKTFAGGTPRRNEEAFYKNGNIPWVKSGEVCERYIFDTEEYITEKALHNSSARLIGSNSLLVALYGATAGQVGILKIEASSNQAVLAVSVNRDEFSISFLYYFLSHFTKSLLRMVQGSGQPNLSKKIVDSLFVPIPHFDEQASIAELLDTVSEKVNTLDLKKKEYQKLKNGLMQQLLTGKIRVNNLVEA